MDFGTALFSFLYFLYLNDLCSQLIMMYKRLLAILIFLFPVCAHAQQERIIYYANGRPQFILSYMNGTLAGNTFLAPSGDTVYKWNMPARQITEFPITGDYLLKDEYTHIKAEMAKSDQAFIAGGNELNRSFLAPSYNRDWQRLYTVFFANCPDYTRIVREGDFTIYVDYKKGKQWGSFKKYHQRQLIVSGQYVNGKMDGVWHYYPYTYYPYYDITFIDRWGREWSYFYSLLPFIIIMLGLYIGSRYINPEKYQYYFYAVITLALVSLALRIGIPFNRENIWIRYTIPAIWFTCWQAMIVLAIVNLFFSDKRTNTSPLLNIFCLFNGVAVSIFVLFFKHLDF